MGLRRWFARRRPDWTEEQWRAWRNLPCSDAEEVEITAVTHCLTYPDPNKPVLYDQDNEEDT